MQKAVFFSVLLIRMALRPRFYFLSFPSWWQEWLDFSAEQRYSLWEHRYSSQKLLGYRPVNVTCEPVCPQPLITASLRRLGRLRRAVRDHSQRGSHANGSCPT
jgi:hypothetical protein